MSIDPSGTPYYDDFDENKKFYKILFNPARAVQARELTQIQSVLQNQTKVMADHLFEDGSMVIPGQIGYDSNYHYVKIDDTYLSLEVNLSNFIGKIVTGQTSGVSGQVINVSPAEDTDPKTLYIKYINSGTDNVSRVFQNGEVLRTDSSPAYFCTTKSTDATGIGSAVNIQEGHYYVNGTFALVSSQTLILDKYDNTPSYKVGLEIQESIVDFGDDASLLDLANGTPNFNAPGADRLKIDLILSKRLLTSTDDESFVELLRLSNGEILRKVNSTAYAYLEKEMARRTFEESGDYTVKSFGLDIREHLNDGTNRGIYLSGDGGDATKIALGIEPGLAYVKGYRVENISTQFIPVDKARSFAQANNNSVSAGLGNYIIINGGSTLHTFPSISNFPLISLRDTVVSTGGTIPGAEIGTARVRLIELHSGVAGSGTEKYRLYLFNILMNTSQLFSSVKSIGLAGSPAFTANISLVDSKAEIYEANQSISLFALPNTTIKTVRDASNSVDTSYDVKREYTGTTNGSGAISFGPLTTNESFAQFTTTDYVLTRLDTGAFIDLTGKVALAGSPVGKTLQLTGLPNSTAVRLVATVTKQVAQEKSKTLQTSTLAVTSPTNNISLGRADVYKIVAVYDSEDTGVNATTSDTNITTKYSLDTGQRDTHYDIASINLKQGQTAPIGRILIEYQYFSHGTGDYFSVDSYTNQVTYENIPSYTSSNGVIYDLRDCLDFRPRIDNTGANFTGSGASSIEIIKPDSFIRADFQYYLNRIDKVYVNSRGEFGTITGVPDLDPIAPRDLPDALTLYNLSIRAYTFSPLDVLAEVVDNRRYTMRDIGSLEKRISNLEYYVTLSLLEKETADLQVIDPVTGLDRFKNGFIVDGFTGHGVGDVLNLDYKCSIDKQKRICRPGFQTNNIKLNFNAVSSSGITKTGDLITLPYTETSFITQPFASRKENVNPYNIFTFIGSIELTPPNDEWKDEERQPDLNVNIPDNADLIVDLANRTGISGTQWDAWQTQWTGASNVQQTSSTVIEAGPNIGNTAIGQPPRWPLRQVTTTRTVVSTQVGQTRTGVQTSVSAQAVTRNLGDRVVSVDIIPFIRSRTIEFSAKRLKPLTRVYPFFDSVAVSSFCAPTGGLLGDPIITDINGACSGTFTIPNTDTIRFRTGERVFKLTDSATDNNDNTTQAEVSYQAQGLLESKEQTILSTRVAQVDRTRVNENRVITQTSVTQNVAAGAYYDPLAQTFLVEERGGCFITSVDIFFNSKDDNIPVTLQLRSTVNGYPGQYIFPFGEVTLNPDQVNISSSGLTATRFTFPSPVYMLPSTEYCFVLLSDSNKYEAFVGRIGETELSSNRLISEQPYAGVMFKSQNASTWTPDQTQDIKFTLNKAVFQTNVNGTVILENDTVPTQLLDNNPFSTTSGSSLVRVYHKAHGFTGTDSVSFTGIPSGTYNGITSVTLNGTFSVTSIEFNSYVIDVGTNANATGSVGGNTVRATRNVQMDVFQPIIAESVLSGTNSVWESRTITGKHPHGSQTPYVIDSTYSLIDVNENNYPVSPRIIASQLNETNEISGAKSLLLRNTISTSNPNISPVIDTQRMSIIAVANMCDSPTNGNTHNYVAETDSGIGSAISKYITKIVTLTESAISLKIFLAVSCPREGDVDLYYRTKGADDSTLLENVDWTLLAPEHSKVFSDNEKVFKEYNYLADDLEQFASFQVKIVMKTTDSTKVPLLKDFRAIALGT